MCIYRQLDGKTLNPCPANVIVLKNLAVNHDHKFLLNVTTSGGQRNSSSYSWFIGKTESCFLFSYFGKYCLKPCSLLVLIQSDTIPPTATVFSKQNYTNAERIVIDVTFSEACNGRGGFKCLNSSNCDVSGFLGTIWITKICSICSRNDHNKVIVLDDSQFSFVGDNQRSSPRTCIFLKYYQTWHILQA